MKILSRWEKVSSWTSVKFGEVWVGNVCQAQSQQWYYQTAQLYFLDCPNATIRKWPLHYTYYHLQENDLANLKDYRHYVHFSSQRLHCVCTVKAIRIYNIIQAGIYLQYNWANTLDDISHYFIAVLVHNI